MGAIYLSGYAVEMALKRAYFRLIGYSLRDPIQTSDLHAAFGHARTALQFLNVGKNLHDLETWARLLVEERKLRQRPYGADRSRKLTGMVARLKLHWSEFLRYRANRPYQHEAAEALEIAGWVYEQLAWL
jgi:hypothetical protein